MEIVIEYENIESRIKEMPISLYWELDGAFSVVPKNFKHIINHHRKEVHPDKQSWCRFCQGIFSVTPLKAQINRGATPVRLPSGLLPRVHQFLKNKKHDVVIIDKRTKPILHPIEFSADGYESRDYQEKIIGMVPKIERGQWQLPTGTGKTYVMARIVAKLGIKTLIVVPSKAILSGFVDELSKIIGEDNVGIIGGGEHNESLVDVALHQAITSKKDKEFLGQYRCLCFDEHHHTAAKTLGDIHDGCINAYYRYGQSAELTRADRKDLWVEGATGPIRYVLDPQEAREEGFQANLKVACVNFPAKYRQGSYHKQVERNITDHLNFNTWIFRVAEWHLDNFEKDKILILTGRVKHAEYLGELFDLDGIECEVITGSMSDAEERFERFASGEVRVLIGTQALDEGVNVPDCNVLFLLNQQSALGGHKQRLGRVARRKENDNNTAYVYDINMKNAKHLENAHNMRKVRYKNWGFDVATYDAYDIDPDGNNGELWFFRGNPF